MPQTVLCDSVIRKDRKKRGVIEKHGKEKESSDYI